MGVKNPLYFQGGDVLATADDDVLLAIGDLDVAFPVDCGHVVGGEPVVLIDGIFVAESEAMSIWRPERVEVVDVVVSELHEV
jgi:hypothetical protein